MFMDYIVVDVLFNFGGFGIIFKVSFVRIVVLVFGVVVRFDYCFFFVVIFVIFIIFFVFLFFLEFVKGMLDLRVS